MKDSQELNNSDLKPFYKLLEKALSIAIRSGTFVHGGKLPPARELAVELGMARGTVVRCYRALAAKGYAKGTVGSGTCITQPWQLEPERRAAPPIDFVDAYVSAYANRLLSQNLNADVETRLGTDVAVNGGPPFARWRKTLRRQLRSLSVMPIDDPFGLYSLRSALSTWLNRTLKIGCNPEQLALFASPGTFHDTLARLLVNPGDRILFPSDIVSDYSRAKACFSSYGGVFENMPPRQKLTELDKALNHENEHNSVFKLGFVYYGADVEEQNQISLPLRRELLAMTENTLGIVVENFTAIMTRQIVDISAPNAKRMALEKHERLIQWLSLSQMLRQFCHFDVVVLPSPLVEIFRRALTVSPNNICSYEQKAMLEFIESGDFDACIRRIWRNL